MRSEQIFRFHINLFIADIVFSNFSPLLNGLLLFKHNITVFKEFVSRLKLGRIDLALLVR